MATGFSFRLTKMLWNSTEGVFAQPCERAESTNVVNVPLNYIL